MDELGHAVEELAKETLKAFKAIEEKMVRDKKYIEDLVALVDKQAAQIEELRSAVEKQTEGLEDVFIEVDAISMHLGPI